CSHAGKLRERPPEVREQAARFACPIPRMVGFARRLPIASMVFGVLIASQAPHAATAASSSPTRTAVAERFRSDPHPARLALDLFDATGDEVDVLSPQRIDGGYRGMIQLVPALPVGSDRKHLAWVASALRDFDEFFAAMGARGATPRYRWRALKLRFYR